jgi:hypothetical protein
MTPLIYALPEVLKAAENLTLLLLKNAQDEQIEQAEKQLQNAIDIAKKWKDSSLIDGVFKGGK